MIENPGREPVAVLVRRHGVAIACTTALLLAVGILASPSGWFALALLPLAPLAAACAVIDLHTHRLPTPLVRAAGACGLGTLTVAATATGAWGDLGRAILGGLTVGAAFFAKWWFTRGGTGMGDVRLAAVLGTYAGWLGWSEVLAWVLLAYLLALPVALARLARRRHDPLPFGPALVAGWYLTVALGAWN